jgi:hypothetical protein
MQVLFLIASQPQRLCYYKSEVINMAVVPVRAFLEERGHKVDWDNDKKEISVDGKLIDKSLFTLEGQRHYGTPTDIMNAIGQGGYRSPYATTVDPTKTAQLNSGIQNGLISQNEYKGLSAMLFNEADKANPNSVNNIMNQLANRQPYQSQYGGQISGLMDKINQPFQYNPSTDLNLANAQQQVMESMNDRGILNSTMTSEEALKLVPQFQQQAYNQYVDQQNSLMRQAEFYRLLDNEGYNRYMDEADSLYKRANFINGLDEQAYQRYKDGVTQDYNDRMFMHEQKAAEAQAQKQAITDAWYRVNQLGYVDNEASIVLGVPVGTPSKEARENAIKRQQEIEDMIVKEQQTAARDDYLFGQELALIQERENSAIRQTQAQGQKEVDVFNYKNAVEGQQAAAIDNAFQQMMASGNPSQWLEQNAGQMTLDVYKALRAQLPQAGETLKPTFTADDYAKQAQALLNNKDATPIEGVPKEFTNKYNAIEYLYQIELGGQIPGEEIDDIYYLLQISDQDMVKYKAFKDAMEKRDGAKKDRTVWNHRTGG